MDLNIPNEFAPLLQQKATAAGFDDVTQYVVHLVQTDDTADDDGEWIPDPSDPRIIKAIDEGIASGDAIEVTPEFWQKIRDELHRKLAEKA
jgi:hypothetical protein